MQSDAFAAKLTVQFERDLDRSEAIEPGRRRDRPLHHRARKRAMAPARREF